MARLQTTPSSGSSLPVTAEMAYRQDFKVALNPPLSHPQPAQLLNLCWLATRSSRVQVVNRLVLSLSWPNALIRPHHDGKPRARGDGLRDQIEHWRLVMTSFPHSPGFSQRIEIRCLSL